MATLEQSVKPVLQAKTVLAANGRIVIPAAIREALGFKPGETLLMDIEDGALRIETYPARIERIQQEIAKYIPETGRILSEELDCRTKRRSAAGSGKRSSRRNRVWPEAEIEREHLWMI